MPDVNNALKFNKKMIESENAYLRQVAQYRQETRRNLLEIVQRDGVSRPATQQMAREIQDLSRKITAAASLASRDIRNHVKNYTQKQVQLAKRAGLTKSDDIQMIIAAGATAAQDGEQAYMTNNSAWLGNLETTLQTNAARLRISNASPQEITDRLLSETMADGRASVWRVSGSEAQTEETSNFWLYGIGLMGVYLATFNESQPVQYKKQAIATIDERTTDCCLQVHGQIRDIDEPFHLTGTPRYADEIQDPPFHWYCRTSEVLYHEAFEEYGITTARMEEMAQVELEARAKDKNRVTIYPSHATARRPMMPRSNDRK